MTAGVLDASALLAVYFEEPGADTVEALGPFVAMSTPNWCETAEKALQRGDDPASWRRLLTLGGLRIEPLTVEDAERAAALRGATRRAGLSLADRSCLALAERLSCPAYTADRPWAELDLPIEVRLIH